MKPKRERLRPLQKGYIGQCIDNGRDPRIRIIVGVPMTGLLRSEWVLARYGQVIPCNWSASDCVQWLDQYSPLRYAVADARNLIVDHAVKVDAEWLLFIDHDTIPPPTMLLKMNDYMLAGEPPIVGGLYFTKSVPAEPLVYRGSGTSYYGNWKLGDKVWVDGLGMGCTLIHGSILKAVWEDSVASDGTTLPSEVMGSTKRTACTASTAFSTRAVGNSSATQYFYATFPAGFLSGAGSNLSNIGLYATTDTSDTLFCGNTYASSACASNQAVNCTYEIRFG